MNSQVTIKKFGTISKNEDGMFVFAGFDWSAPKGQDPYLSFFEYLIAEISQVAEERKKEISEPQPVLTFYAKTGDK